MGPAVKIGHAELVGTFRQDSPEWHEARAQVIGGSDIAPILGLSSYKSAFTLWQEKFKGLPQAPRDPKAQRKLDYGHHMEPFVADLFRANHPELDVHMTGSWRNVDRSWQGCNPDRLVTFTDRPVEDSHALVQIKTANFPTDWEDGIPADYLAQVRWELDTFGFPRGWLIVYFNVSGDYMEYEVEADPYDAEAARMQALQFFNAEAPPEIDGSDSTFQTLRRLNPSITPKLEVTVEARVAQMYLDARAALKDMDQQLLKWKGHLLAHMGTAQYALDPFDGRRIASRVAVKDGVPYLKEI